MDTLAVIHKEPPGLKQVFVSIDVHMGSELTDGSYSPRVLATPDPSFAPPGAELIWVSSHPFTIRYDHATPLRHMNEVRSGLNAGRHQAKARIRDDAQRVEPYKYTIALMFEELGQVIIADPNTVVDPDPSPPSGLSPKYML
jgi:hypothetical protein